jgi:hypothetical protein
MYITVYSQFDYICRLKCDPNLKTEVFKMKYMCYHTLIGTKALLFINCNCYAWFRSHSLLKQIVLLDTLREMLASF